MRAIAIAEALKTNNTIKSISFKLNQIDDYGVEFIAEALRHIIHYSGLVFIIII
jgi:hypothetical protein